MKMILKIAKERSLQLILDVYIQYGDVKTEKEDQSFCTVK